ncbi:MAG TPA: hypothetical protein DE315_06725 [Candidatus Omnitrophica bacterium]|nr:hypothetical protein [Candidatus Omnitrophota bacterium]HCI45204.1 hypothetical protein [Candidatus Omnitrophota bacterium]
MSWIDFSECKTVKEIGEKFMARFNGSESHVAMATAFAHQLLQKELLIEQNKYQEKQLEKMQELNRYTRGLVLATWALVIISSILNIVCR